ncbi:hypothetical protein GTO91_17345 [Heliobacterium undosum]|uniref:PilZ domain-containing protein n=1 Tax=Heliomicrobium undosum TaxID=121734 RepID=A0A845L836_9FIRM|nr:hypothetical protein [Heliomicrobium undosum]MZP31459.1 hypothetical protein [Heliomicrobium undosum]
MPNLVLLMLSLAGLIAGGLAGALLLAWEPPRMRKTERFERAYPAELTVVYYDSHRHGFQAAIAATSDVQETPHRPIISEGEIHDVGLGGCQIKLLRRSDFAVGDAIAVNVAGVDRPLQGIVVKKESPLFGKPLLRLKWLGEGTGLRAVNYARSSEKAGPMGGTGPDNVENVFSRECSTPSVQ